MLQLVEPSAQLDQPRRILPDDPALPSVLLMLQGAFSYMDGRIDPPSSIKDVTTEAFARTAAEAELWAIGLPPKACVVLRPMRGRLYLGRLAVCHSARGRGLARRLVDLAVERAQQMDLPCIELQSRVELVENHATFSAMGFRMVAETTHPGFDRPTSLTFRRDVRPS